MRISPDSKVHGDNMGPTWVLPAPDGPHVGHMNLGIRVIMQYHKSIPHKGILLWGFAQMYSCVNHVFWLVGSSSSLWCHKILGCLQARTLGQAGEGQLGDGEFNSLAPGKFKWKFRYGIFKRIWVIDGWLRHLLWKYHDMNVTGLHWWSVNIGSGNGLVPSGNKPLPEPLLTKICVAIWHH